MDTLQYKDGLNSIQYAVLKQNFGDSKPIEGSVLKKSLSEDLNNLKNKIEKVKSSLNLIKSKLPTEPEGNYNIEKSEVSAEKFTHNQIYDESGCDVNHAQIFRFYNKLSKGLTEDIASFKKLADIIKSIEEGKEYRIPKSLIKNKTLDV